MGIISNKDDDLIYKKSQIELFFSIHSNENERAEYLKSAYQDRYTEKIIDGKRVGYKPEADGLLMWKGSYLKRTSESVFSWDLISQFTAGLIDKKEYHINRDIKPLKSQDGQQMSLFDFNYDMPNTGDNQFSFFKGFEISQEVIDQALCLGGNDPKSLERICSYFAKDYSIEQNAEFLREEYKTDGKGFYSGSNPISLWFDDNGIRIAEGKTAESSNSTLLTWADAAKRVRELLDMGRHAPSSVLEHSAANNERKDLAATLWYIVQDFSDEAKNGNLIPTILDIYYGRSGFPDNTAEIEKLLKDDEIVKKLVTELTDFIEKYDESPALLRYAFHRPKKTLEQLKGLLRPQLDFTVHPDFSYEPKQFITNDEIDKILINSRDAVSKHRINEYFHENHTPKERIALLKKLYGTGGSVRLGFNNSYDSKGFLCSRGNISAPYDKVLLKWNQVEKRIGELIKQGRYLTDEDRKKYANYLKEQADWQKKAERLKFINKAHHIPLAEKRDTLPLRLSYFIQDLDNYEKNLLSNVECSDLADVTAEQIQQHLNDPDTVKQLIDFLAMVQGRTVSADNRNNSWRFVEELMELPRLYYDKPQEQTVTQPEKETKDSAIALYSNDFEKMAIILTPNGKYFNYYGYDENNGSFNTRAGGFDSFEHAEKALYSHRPTAKKLTERDVNNETTPLADSLEQEQENSNVINDSLEIGTELSIDDRNFVIDSIKDKVSLRDITFQNSTGFPVFRSESIDFVRHVIAEQKKKQELLELVREKLDESGYVVSDELLEVGLEDYSGKGNYEDIADFIEKEYLTENQFDNELQSLENQIKQRLDAVSDSKGYSELKKDVERLLLDKNGDSLVGITSDVWIKQLLDLSTDEFRKYVDEYQSGALNASSLLKPIENSTDLQEKLSPPKPIRKKIRFTKQHPEIEQRYNFHITDHELGNGTDSEKYAANIAAIRTLKQIENENRLATPGEQDILSRYVGWGGLANYFEENHTNYDELNKILTEEEYTAARESTLTAYYTLKQYSLLT